MPRYVVGIDLGTTNSAVAYVPLDAEASAIEVLPIPQLIGPGSCEERPLLPSFLYLLQPEERSSAAFRLPWDDSSAAIAGEFARCRAADVPHRVIASAKSWLCVDSVDRHSPILPWNSDAEGEKLSPVAASACYLRHLQHAWEQRFPEAPLAEQEIVLGVPASFDPVARELTVQAAALAGLGNVTLIEEPQAAFYAWLADLGNEWHTHVAAGELILVCDVGGGTTDFTLIEVREDGGQLALERLAVGDHILLGGDNMDLALAHAVRARLATEGTTLDTWQFRSLVLACRDAKEALLSDVRLTHVPVAILGRGRRLIGGTVRTEVDRSLVEQVLTEGFFPFCERDAEPEGPASVGVTELGLPYAADPAITRHLAAFLSRARTTEGESIALPSSILFHGGALRSQVLRERLLAAIRSWSACADRPRPLGVRDFSHAVCRGAAYYGFVRARGGVRIRGGVGRAYYLGIATAMPAVPGMQPPLKAFCVVPRGLEEGSEVELPQREFALFVGREAEFRLFQSAVRSDPPGVLIEDLGPEFQELPPVRTRLDSPSVRGQRVPVYLRAKVNELGTLELCFVERHGPGRWKLEFDLRASERNPNRPSP